ncbi:serine/threonine-protein kinase [Actinomycetota bacterium Odt1-20B]
MASHGDLIAGRYRITARLGRGGMGTVWRAQDELLGRAVAVKELHVDDGLSAVDAQVQRERVLREARTVAQIRHPGILVLHDVVQHDGQPWLVMELINGRSLADRITAEGPLPPAEAARIGLDLLAALRAAHSAGVLHRDLKPANVLLESGSNRVVLSDFGIAQLDGQTTLTATGSFVGSPEYTAPERMSGRRTGPESDLWSLGVLLCAAVEGESPFHRDSVAGVLHAVVVDEVRLPESAGVLLPVVRGLLERDAERRFDTAEAERALQSALSGAGSPNEYRAPGAGRPPHGEAATVPHTHAAPPPPPPAATLRQENGPGRQGTPGDPGEPVVHASARAANRRGRRGRRALVIGVTVAALAAGGVGAGVWAMTRDDTNSSAQSAGSGGAAEEVREQDVPTPHPSKKQKDKKKDKKTSAPKPDTSRPGRKKGDGPKVPTRAPEPAESPASAGSPKPTTPSGTGYHTVTDPTGFSFSAPTGFTRTPEGPRVYYYSPGKEFRIGVHPQEQDPAGPYEVMRQAHKDGPSDYPGYRAASVTKTTHNGHPAALWVFTWDGSSADGGPRTTWDLSWDEGGKMYDLWVSAPTGQQATGKRHFDKASGSFKAAAGG